MRGGDVPGRGVAAMDLRDITAHVQDGGSSKGRDTQEKIRFRHNQMVNYKPNIQEMERLSKGRSETALYSQR